MTEPADHREVEERIQAARLDGARLAVRTLQHELNNRLMVVVGFAELLVKEPSLPTECQVFAQRCLDGAVALAEALDRTRTIVRLVETAHGQPYGPLIDFDRSRDHGAG